MVFKNNKRDGKKSRDMYVNQGTMHKEKLDIFILFYPPTSDRHSMADATSLKIRPIYHYLNCVCMFFFPLSLSLSLSLRWELFLFIEIEQQWPTLFLLTWLQNCQKNKATKAKNRTQTNPILCDYCVVIMNKVQDFERYFGISHIKCVCFLNCNKIV